MATIARWKRHVNVHLLNHPSVSRVLSPRSIDQLCRDQGHRWRASFWSPRTTLIAFLLQVLDGAKTLRSAVALLLVQLADGDAGELPSPDPSAYCQARRRLPGSVIGALLRRVTDQIREAVTDCSGWLGRQVWIVDGSSASMPDTPELQRAFPQPSGQAPGCGFPVVKFVALFCWTAGTVIDLAVGNCRAHDLPLFRQLWHHFRAGDVVLADRAYCSYVDLARLSRRGVDCVFRLHQRRPDDFRKGRPLGDQDRLVTWKRPRQWLASMGIGRATLEGLPEKMTVRLVRITNVPPGFRARKLTVATTLTDPREVPADAIRALYRDRWTAELNLRSLKTHLGMDILRGQSLDVVSKEIAMHLLAYNLIRLLMWEAAREHDQDLHDLSFTGTLHRLRAALPLMMVITSQDRRRTLMANLLYWIAQDRLPRRPDRIEPRRVKRRPKQYSLLRKPRRDYRKHGDPDAR